MQNKQKGLRFYGLFYFVATMILAFLIAFYFFIKPRQQYLYDSKIALGTYHGFGFHSEPGILGKNWDAVRWNLDDGYTLVTIGGNEYSPFRSFYANGNLRAEGECSVKLQGYNEPDVDTDDVLNGTFYDPNGNVISKVVNGTGKTILCYSNGTKYWEQDLVNGNRQSVCWYSPSGVLYLSEKKNGVYISHYANGILKTHGQRKARKNVGKWYRFYDDASVESIEDHETDPPTTISFQPGEKFLDEAAMKQFEIE